MVYSQSGVAGVCVAEIIPESIDLLFGIKFPDRIGPSLAQKRFERHAGFRQKQGVFYPTFRLINVKFGRDYVVITGEYDRFSTFVKFGGMVGKPLKPP